MLSLICLLSCPVCLTVGTLWISVSIPAATVVTHIKTKEDLCLNVSFICCIESVMFIVTLIYVYKIIMGYKSAVSLMSCLSHPECLRHVFLLQTKLKFIVLIWIYIIRYIYIQSLFLIGFSVFIHMLYIFVIGKRPSVIAFFFFFAQKVSMAIKIQFEDKLYLQNQNCVNLSV